MKALPTLILLIFTLGTGAALAGSPPEGMVEQPLLELTSDRNDTVYHLGLVLNEAGQVTGLFNRHVYPGNDPSAPAETTFTLAAIESARGVVLFNSNNFNALLLSGRYDEMKQAGRFTVHYLANGLTGGYRSCDFLLGKSGGEWIVLNAYNHTVVKAIRVVTYMLGISDIQGLCPAQ